MVCNIELPMGMEELVNLKYLGLNVAESSSIIDIPGGILGKLLSLQYLALCVQITARKEVANLKRLEYIHSRFSDVSDLNAFVGSRGREFLPYYSIAVSKSHELIFFSRDARLIVLAGVDIGREPIEFSSNVERLRIEHVKGGTRSLNDCAGMASLRAATGLRHLKISHCGEMECVFSAWRPQINNLTALLLSGLEKLTALFGFVSCPSTGMLSSLAGIHIYKCHKLRELFSFGCLPANLEEIDVSCCDQMEKIVTWGEGSIIASGSVNNSDTAQTQLLCFPKLKKLMLWNLPQLRSVLAKSGVIMACDALVQIAIWDCPLLRSVPLHLTPDRHLEEIVVRNCAQMKEIVTCVEGSGIASGSINNSDTTQTQLLRLPKLKKLELWDLPQLEHVPRERNRHGFQCS